MAIAGERIREISGRKQKAEQIKGLNLNITIDDVRVNDKNVEIDYSYTANYNEGVGNITIKGTILAVEDASLAKKIGDEWKKNKKLLPDYTPLILSAINYSGSANGTLLARVLNLAAPLIPPRIELSKPPAAHAK